MDLKKRPHYHGILALEKRYYPEHPLTLEKKFFNSVLAEWKRNLSSSTKYPKWQPLLTYKRIGIKRNYDFHYIINLKDHSNDLSFYLSKYLFKYDKRTVKLLQKIKLDPSLSHEETSTLIKQIKPRSCMSKDFGSPTFLSLVVFLRLLIIYLYVYPGIKNKLRSTTLLRVNQYLCHLIIKSIVYILLG